MKLSIRYIYTFLILVIFVLSITTDWYRQLTVALGIVLIVTILDKMGRGIVFRESTAFLYVLTCLIMPLVGYVYFTSDNQLAKMWVKHMPVPEEIYFSFALPAVTAFSMTLICPLGIKEQLDEGQPLLNSLRKVREVMGKHKNLGIVIVVTGIVFNMVVRLLPGGLQFFVTLFYFGCFAGLLYVYFAPPFRYKKLIIILFIGYILANALNSGMFTIVAYMGVTLFSFFIVSARRSFLRNLVILILAVGFILVLQSTKGAYRKYTWQSNYGGSKAVLFTDLFLQTAKKGDALLEKSAFFNTYVRTNQGFNVALVMRRIPVYQPYDNGNNLVRVIASAFVPRFLWPDKPEAGGKFNMQYYAGYTIRGWSTNVGPLGEAYGSFGVTGGILYMLLLGAFIRWAYKLVFVFGKKSPLLICWIPLLFYQVTYSAETDTLQILNSLIKSAFFVWLLYKMIPIWFGIVKQKAGKRVVVKSVVQ